MAHISDHHQYLFLGKLTHSLSPEEDQELQELFAHDDQALEAYNELVRQLPEEQVAQSFSHLDSPGFWENLPGQISEQQTLVRQSKIRRTIALSSIISLLAIGSWLFLAHHNRSDSRNLSPLLATANHPAIELKLADGTTVDLNTVQGNLKKGQLVINNHDHALSYQSAEPASGPASGTNLGENPATPPPTRMNTLSVPVAMDYKITLGDGSEIWLNSASSLSFPSSFTSEKREITLTGEAWCKIAPHPGQPFIIHLPDNTIEVTGTEFNVNTYTPNTVKVALVNGGVNLLSGANKVKVNPGFQAISKAGAINQAPFEERKVLCWRKGMFIFEASGLDELSPVLARWYGIKTQLDNPTLANKKFFGVLDKNRPLNSFLDDLKSISDMNYYFDNKGVLHFTTQPH